MGKYIAVLLGQLLSIVCLAQVKVKQLRCENLDNPIGIDIVQPHFSWQLESPKRNVLQSAYELRVSKDLKGRSAVWNSGKVRSDSSVFVTYKGSPLQSGKRYYWQVRVWDNGGTASAWSTPAFFQVALLHPSEWKAQWITPGYTEDSVLRPSPLFRKPFTARKKVRSATAYITAHGLYEAYLNGRRIGDAYLTPGWTSYHKRLQYQVYDVSDLVKEGHNAVGVMLGNGWYRGYVGYKNKNNGYGKDIALLLQLDITYSDGSSESIVSDGSWKSSTGSIVTSEIYNGETIDNRKQKEGWLQADYRDSDWPGVQVQNFSKEVLLATYNEPVKKHETFKPVKVITTPKGEKVLDFGQNLVGWVVVKARGKAGDSLAIQHAEVLDKEGNFYTENLRAAKATDTYILSGKGEETFEPHFTFHGFRYIRLEGLQGDVQPEDYTAVALYSDMKSTGSFTTSNALLNQLQHNIQWGQRGNFLDVPTDCPQRDERLGWTGDAQVFARTAAFNMGVNNFFDKWLRDVAADQTPKGSVPSTVPNVLGLGSTGSAGWADAATIIPWNMYLAYGNKQILEQQYPSMKAWVEYIRSISRNDLWNKGVHYGDWLFYRPFDDNDGRAAVTDKYLIAQCFYAHSTQLLINAANVLGKTDDAKAYKELLQRIKEAFVKEYMTPNGRLVSGTQTAYTLALNFDMLPESLRAQAAQRLADNIKDYNYHLTTGFLGTPYLCHVLTRFGYDTTAYKLLLQDSYPSWLYPVKMGATTIWERWNGIGPDGSFAPASMNSFNHYAYGAIGDWMYRSITGLDTYEDGPGYKHIKVKPVLGGGLTSAAATLQTNYGALSNSWKMDNGRLLMDVVIPANTTAIVYVPAINAEGITESGKGVVQQNSIQVKGKEGNYVVLQVGSGAYHFEVTKPVLISAKK